MAQSGRFQLSVRVLAVLASEPDAMHTSSAIAEALKESAVMVRRTFLLLQKAGLIVQRKGPHGGAKLKVPEADWAGGCVRGYGGGLVEHRGQGGERVDEEGAGGCGKRDE